MEMNKLKKQILSIIVLILMATNIFAVEVIQNAPVVIEKKPLLTDQQKTIVVWGLIIMIFLALISWLIWWIIKKIKENQRKDKDLLYSKYLIDLKNTNQNKDGDLKYKSIFKFFLFWNRVDVVLNTERGLKYFGKYDGELIVKNNFFLVTIHRPSGWFSSEKDIIIIPYNMRTLFRKEKVNGKYVVLLDCESIDEALNTDYYNTIVVKNPLDNNGLINFNGYIEKFFMKDYVLHQVIKDDLLNYKESMDKSVELNPSIQVSRKDPKN